MARVLIIEPERDLRRLAEQAVLELGHEPLLADADAPAAPVDVLLLAASAEAAERASALRRRQPGLAIVCLGVTPASRAIRALGPVTHLMKPYTLAELDAALSRALAAPA